MIATEAGAEGINLQFCSLVINYDLPWNPQRIEQRIGRCHRYGQKHDVVVVNFLNTKNAADKRVYELLSEKFQLFEGVFGTSDEVLGAIESGVDFERRIADIYQRCRQPEEIASAFDQLQQELSYEIKAAMSDTRRKLLENFDDEVREKLKVREQDSKEMLTQFEQRLMHLTRHELDGKADFFNQVAFDLYQRPTGAGDSIPLGRYELPRQSGDAFTYRLGHPLADAVIAQAKQRPLPTAMITFDYSAHDGKITILKPLLGQQGALSLSLLRVTALEQMEEYLLFAAVTAAGEPLDKEQAERLLSLPGRVTQPEITLPAAMIDPLDSLTKLQEAERHQIITKRNAAFFEAETEKLDRWAEDLKVVLEREIKELDRQIREAKRAATAGLTLEEKLAGQKQVKELEKLRSQKRRSLFEAQDQVDEQRDRLIAEIEGKLEQESELKPLFTISWKLG
jgi:adenine-specific DNA-methyltransferase